MFGHNQKEDIDIPDRIRARPVRKLSPIAITIIVAIVMAMFIHGLITNPSFDWPTVWKYMFNEHVLEGITWTILLTVCAMALATILATILAVMRTSSMAVLRVVSWFFIWIFRGTPVYTQLVFWGLFAVIVPKLAIGIPFGPEFFSINTQDVLNATAATVLGLGLNEAAYLSEIVRAGIDAVDPGQTEAAQALGMSKALIMRRVVFPQAMRIIVPPTGNEAIGMLKTTSLASAVPFTLELQFATNAIANRIYKTIPLLIVASIWYLIITTVLMVVQARIEKHYGKGFDSRPLADSMASKEDHYSANAMDKRKVDKLNQVVMSGLNA